MNKPEIVKVIILSLAAIMWLTIITPMVTTLMRRPSILIRHHFLRLTPIGTSIDDVIAVIDSRDDFSWNGHVSEHGFSTRTFSRPPPSSSGIPDVPRIGEKSIRVRLGNYQSWYSSLIGLSTNVYVHWGFDGDGKLIAVGVIRRW